MCTAIYICSVIYIYIHIFHESMSASCIFVSLFFFFVYRYLPYHLLSSVLLSCFVFMNGCLLRHLLSCVLPSCFCRSWIDTYLIICRRVCLCHLIFLVVDRYLLRHLLSCVFVPFNFLSRGSIPAPSSAVECVCAVWFFCSWIDTHFGFFLCFFSRFFLWCLRCHEPITSLSCFFFYESISASCIFVSLIFLSWIDVCSVICCRVCFVMWFFFTNRCLLRHLLSCVLPSCFLFESIPTLSSAVVCVCAI